MNDFVKTNRRTKINMQVNDEAEKFYSKAQDFGLLSVQSFYQQNEGKRGQHRSQMTGLENIAETTMKVSDVLDYIKKQTARQPGWNRRYESGSLNTTINKYQDYEGKCFGEILKDYIETDLKDRREKICSSIGINGELPEDQRDYQLVYLHLIRQFVRQLVVHYEYTINKPGDNQESKGNRDRR